MCKYTLNEKNKAPFPRVRYLSECGFDLVLMEGYKHDIDGGRTSDLISPSGSCMKCKGEIECLKN